jgi:hypothetical protein
VQRTQIYLPEADHAALRGEAKRRGWSLTELIRQLVRDHLEGRRGLASIAKESALRFVALGASGQSDTSERHDAALDDAFRGDTLR